MRLKTNPKRRNLENTIPLINIVFLMLIFFLFAGTIDRDDAKNINPAHTQETSQPARIAGALIIAADGTMKQNEKPIVAQAILPGEENAEALTVVADKTLSATKLAGILAVLKKNGFSEITLMTIRNSK
ncbi:Biopolymer transport protein ExbD/TolR [Pseudovibrio axinellae]|uniref:Biopolymer transport protein ExbD/TolR n=1 Tax=Pseudovibrio axinellae TaxID=989403 RepID=A0A165ZS89_9HYPH|nr:biopolymer transporter ExbD [Pseudovibrio axinellae]KZL20223.1 Biopolymer transport protein ExbD/TolR [Pseudovibrio axinellae]SEQ61631.1 outer membrane transport energization protein ExbD [Pseudovibrio axinellae]